VEAEVEGDTGTWTDTDTDTKGKEGKGAAAAEKMIGALQKPYGAGRIALSNRSKIKASDTNII